MRQLRVSENLLLEVINIGNEQGTLLNESHQREHQIGPETYSSLKSPQSNIVPNIFLVVRTQNKIVLTQHALLSNVKESVGR